MPEANENAGEIRHFNAEAILIQKRERLHHEVGRLSTALNEASKAFHACVHEIIKTDGELKARGIDTTELAKKLYNRGPASDHEPDYEQEIG